VRPLISIVVNVTDYEKPSDLARCLESVRGFADEIVVIDMETKSGFSEIAKNYGAKVFPHRYMDCVEPARNYGISKAKGRWVLVLDPDEKVTKFLAKKLQKIARGKNNYDCVLVPRKNIIFGKWLQNSRWWPDYLPRFFKKGKIVWPKLIHQQPNLNDKIIYTLPDNEKFSIIHYNYRSLDQFLTRAKRYAEVQARELIKEKKYQFSNKDLFLKPLGEFLSRFFNGEAYKDGVHGLALSLLQAYTVMLIYLKVWETGKYAQKPLETTRVKEIFSEAVYEIEYWRDDFLLKSSGKVLLPLKKWLLKVRAKSLRL